MGRRAIAKPQNISLGICVDDLVMMPEQKYQYCNIVKVMELEHYTPPI